MGKATWHPDKLIFGRSINTGFYQRGIHQEHRKGTTETSKAGIQDPDKEIYTDTYTEPDPSWNEDKYKVYEPGSPKRQDQGFEKGSIQDNLSWRSSSESSSIFHWESSSYNATKENLTWWRDCLQTWNGRSFLPENPEVEVFTNASDLGTWSAKEKGLNINVRKLIAILKALKLPEIQWKSVMVYADNNTSIAYTYCLTTGTRPQLNYVPSALNPADAPSRMVEQTECTIEPQDTNFCELETSGISSNYKRVQPLMDRMEKPLLLPTLEPYTTDSTKNLQRKSINNIDYFMVENWDMVSGFDGDVDSKTDSDISIEHSPRIIKRKIDYDEEQGVVTCSLEDKRARFEKEGYSKSVINLIFDNPFGLKKEKRYTTIQARFFEWRSANHIVSPDIIKSAPSSVHNYLFQHLVDIYSAKIVEDILSNPVNNQNSFDLSFDVPNTSYSFYDFSNRVESEEDEGS
ncbi:hypothetical protein BB559_002875 [Furculomyces boomerangus]|uniref:Uncharacterized protein n=1 Tax=Furculomyces boomerangus TaxID=61424 RepID=A0A2T9YRC7_9FUNG|nr:hypothetical protein BB559_002875 [Furculomyces boomerangus]